MKKQLLTAFCAIAGIFGLSAQNTVTITVNMNGVTVDPTGVHIAGDFQSEIGASGDWVPGETAMDDSDGDGIYIYTASNLPNGKYEYKFINGNDWPMAENIPAECQVGGGNTNRFFVVDGVDFTLLPVSYGGNSVTDGVNTLNLIRFTVDLTGTTISANGVSCAGDWQAAAGGAADWTPGQNKLYDVTPGDGIDNFTGIFYIPSAITTCQYKFINGNDWGGGESVPTACQVGGGNDNRSVSVTGPTMVKYCFSTCNDVCVAVPTYSITLNVDMNFNCNFNVNSNDSVDIAGPINGWAGGTYLTDVDNDGVYSVTLDAPAGEFTYKARIIKNLSPSWEDGANKVVQLDANTNVPTRCFSSDVAGSCAAIPAPATITFRVDLTNETPSSTIYLKGSFTNPAWDNGKILLTSTPGNPGVYETTVADVCPGTIRYKFVNGPDAVANEEQYPNIAGDTACLSRNPFNNWERIYVRTDANAQTLQYVYDHCTMLTIGFNEVKPLVVTMFPNPADNSTMIRFNNNTESHLIVVSDILGNQVSRIGNVRGSYLVERGTLSSGIYFVQVTDSKGQSSTQKLIFR